MTDTSKQGTGDELGRIDLGEAGELILEDDGDGDKHTYVRWESGGGRTEQFGRTAFPPRGDIGDQAVMDEIAAAGSSDPNRRPRDPSRVSSSSFNRGSPSFQCADCGQTWPRTKNQNGGAGDDICPDCAD